MSDTIVVIFTENNARILRNPIELESLRAMDNTVINPDLTKLTGIPPHLWKQSGDQIVPLTSKEIPKRINHIDRNGLVNTFKIDLLPAKSKILQTVIKYTLILILSVAVSYLIYRYGHDFALFIKNTCFSQRPRL